MGRTIFEWAIQFGLNIFDFVLMYMLTHAFIRIRIKLTSLHLSLGLFYSLVMTPISFMLGSYIFRIIGVVLMLFIMKLIIKRSLPDLLSIYALVLIITGLIQPIPFIAMSFFDLDPWLISLFVQIISTGIMITICHKFKLNKIFNAIQAKIVLKLILFIFALIMLIVVFIMNFEQSIPYFLFFILITVAFILVLFPIFTKLYYQSIGMVSIHDLKNSLLSLGVAMDDMDFEQFKEKFKILSKQFGMDLSQLNASKLETELDYEEHMTNKVRGFIDVKSEASNKGIKVIADVTYHKDCENMDIQIALEWLGSLLDNALEATANQPIYVRLFSSTKRFSIQVANEYLGDSGSDMRRIFEKGYSTKSDGRGLGLHLLHKKVAAQEGIIEADEYYSEDHNCHYLQLNILVKRKRQPQF